MNSAATQDDQTANLVIRNVAILDGSGAPRFAGELAVKDGRILRVGPPGALTNLRAERAIDGGGRALSPGFIDVHSHDDAAMLQGAMSPKVTQGVTTVITGNCGISLAPLTPRAPPPPPHDLLGGQESYRFPRFADYATALESAPAAINAAVLVGHSTLRLGAMSELDRSATAAEIEHMRAALAEALAAGAIGFSTGLAYRASAAASADEVAALLEVLRGKGAVYATHMRDEGDRIAASLDETFETAARTGVPVVVSHFKCSGRRNFGRSAEALARLESARRRQPVGLDAYPYTAASTVLDPAMAEESERVLITWSRPHPECAGQALEEIARTWACGRDAAIARLQPAGAIYFKMAEADVRRILAYPYTMIGSDGLPHDRHPHPRLWGSFPRVLGHYVREVGLFGLEEAVRRMTGLAAERFGLSGRGAIREGAAADLVLFDPETIAERASFETPTRPATGIALVLVNGVAVLEDGQETGARPGRLIRRAGAA